jgi:membrane associated rhomboid family serine protease
MFPLYSDRPLSSVPFITVLLILANCAAFWGQLTFSGGFDRSVFLFGLTPSTFFHPGSAPEMGIIHPYVTVVTSVFMHGGLFHLGSNMLYLWVFGRNIEDDFGHARFLVFYLLSGIAAAVAFAYAYPTSHIPLVGASGAIAGLLGAYFLRFPASRIYTLFIIIILVRIIPVPAFFILGLWFLIQIGSCAVACTTPVGAAGQSGIAFVSHISGFVFGMVFTIWELRRRYYARGRRA